ncbi:MAG: polyribonucleotide nucleotidyltransferase [Clostridia bacterium]|nr:polyribonucleotide nucleotidyltransferase [Clostridia bacterium]
MEHKIYTMELAGRPFSLEFGRYAEQANGACMARYGETAVLVAVTASAAPRPGIDFFPLGCDFEEKMYSVGKIPGGFIRREGRPTEKAILTSRLMDRPLRPLFPKTMRNDVNVVATAMSVDVDCAPELCAMIGSSAALSVSDIPFAGPTGTAIVGMIDGEYILNPTNEQKEKSVLNLTVSGTSDAALMVEAGANEITEDEMLGAILFAHENIKKVVAFINQIVAEIGKPKADFPMLEIDPEVGAAVREYAKDKVEWIFDTFDRTERQNREDQVKEETLEHFAEIYPDNARDIGDELYQMGKSVMRRKILEDGVRPDGRSLTEIRPIWCDVGMLKRAHGSAVFTRGQTQVLTAVTLGTISEAQTLDSISPEDSKRYMHHYNMPPYSTGEARNLRSPGRREIGHGALGERALEPVIPSEEEFPYAIRLVSEVLSSNGSTSQASVCGSTLALMDAGVPIKRPVAGVAMGLIKDADSGKVAVLTDIQGLEDFLGDMDFKVAGTTKGITAIQMDIKIKGIDEPILRQALKQAHEGRLFILDKMLQTLSEPRPELSKYAPKIITFSINPEKIREVIGSGGKVINKIVADTGVKIDLEDDGRVFIATPDAEAAARARAIIEGIVAEIEVGQEYLGTVVRIMDFGAFVELVPGKDGMVHISKLARERVEKVEDVVKIGDKIPVKVAEIDSKGRVNLIRTDVEYAPGQDRPRPPRRENNGGSRGNGRRDFDRKPRREEKAPQE